MGENGVCGDGKDGSEWFASSELPCPVPKDLPWKREINE